MSASTFVVDSLTERGVDATDEEAADLDRRLKEALLSDYRDSEWTRFVVSTHQTCEEGIRVRLTNAAPTAQGYARVWVPVFRAWQIARIAPHAARKVLEANVTDQRAREATAARKLTAAVHDALPELLAAVGYPPHPDAQERALEWIKAQKLPKGALESVAKKEWTPDQWADPARAAQMIAALWWKYRTRKELPANSHAALPSDIMANLTSVRSLQSDLARGLEQSTKKGKTIQSWTHGPAGGPPVVGMDIADLDTARVLRPELLGGITAQRLIRFVMHRSHELYEKTNVIELSTRITIPGGWKGLAHAIGMGTGEKHAKTAEMTARALQAAWVRTPLGEGGLFLVHHEQRHRDSPDEEVSITIHEKGPLSPRYAARLLQGSHTKLVPVPLPELMPPMVGRSNEHGAIATLQLLVLLELRLNATQLVEQGGVIIPTERWSQLAKKAGVPLSLTPKLLDAWAAGDDESPAFIVRQGDRIDLAQAYEKERRFIMDGGKRSLTGSRRGLASQRRRQVSR